MLTPYRILDLTNEKGFFCGRLMADLGAEVIKIEPPGGDPGRDIPPFYKNDPHPEKSLYYCAYNANKKSVTLAIETTNGQDIFRKLVKTADFVIESFKPGHMESLGLGYEDLSNINPRIIVTSISPFGQTGPYRNYETSDLLCSAMSGHMFIIGDPDRAPVHISVPQAYLLGSAEAFTASMAAHYYRQRTGIGQHADAGMGATGITLQSLSGFTYLTGWPDRDPAPPWGAYTDLTAPAFGSAALMAALDYRDRTGKGQYLDLSQYEAWTSRHSPEDIMDMLQKRGISAGVVKNAQDIYEDPQLKEREFFKKLDHPEMGPVSHRSVGFKLSKTPCGPVRSGPCLGEHTEQVCREFLGMSDEEFVDLITAGVFE